MQHILFDARKIRDYGIGTYISSLAAALGRMSTRFRFSSFVPPHLKQLGLLPRDWTVRAVGYRQYSFGEYFLLGSTIGAIHPDVYHATHYTIPRKIPCKTVVTIYDIIPLLFPDIFGPAKRFYARKMIDHALRVGERIVVPSESTKRSILERFSVPDKKIVVIPLGVSERFLSVDRTAAAEAARHKHGLHRPYVLFVSNPKPHKGIETLLEAFGKLDPRFGDLQLVFTGGDGESRTRLEESTKRHGLAGRARILGRLSGDDVVGVFSGADLLVFPSLHEGFGFPLLEAMAVGTPVVSSDAGSLPEVGGDAVCYFRKGSSGELCEKMEKVLSDSDLRASLIERGNRRVKSFSWDETARQTLQVYESVLGKTFSDASA